MTAHRSKARIPPRPRSISPQRVCKSWQVWGWAQHSSTAPTDKFHVKAKEWTYSYSVETAAECKAIWRLMTDFSSWPEWNAGVRAIAPEGSFKAGTWFAMTLPDGDVIRSQIVEFVDGAAFTDETRVGDTLIRVRHELEEFAGDRRKVTYAVHAIGPRAEEFGPGASADFPEVLDALVQTAVRARS